MNGGNSKFASYIPQTPTMLDDRVMSNVAIGQHLDEIDRNKVHEALMQGPPGTTH